ncbi:hypothetical protein [Luteibacter yeojuensis]|uniref:hypothetical protein n=1 Tax=Luteibacter yeojuensis TaxID=345309 RepID=UPI000696997B|nr:hypothetical protein [Luteibacter yeojuensis]
MSQKSEDIVRFVANLLPLYTNTEVDGRTCALSLIDGTVVAPIVDPDLDPIDDDGWVMVYWHGNPKRATEVSGAFFASQAVLRYIELREAGLPAGTYRAERDGLAEHFKHKTGANLYYAEGDIESRMSTTVRTLGGKLFGTVASTIIRHLTGL